MIMDRKTKDSLLTSLRAGAILLAITGFVAMMSPALQGAGAAAFFLGVSLWLAHKGVKKGRPRLAAAVALCGFILAAGFTHRWLVDQGERTRISGERAKIPSPSWRLP